MNQQNLEDSLSRFLARADTKDKEELESKTANQKQDFVSKSEVELTEESAMVALTATSETIEPPEEIKDVSVTANAESKSSLQN